MMQRSLRHRNLLMALDYAHGATYQQLAAKNEISVQRVSQVMDDVARWLRSHPKLLRSERMRNVIADSMRPRPPSTRVAATPEEFFWELVRERENDRSTKELL